MKEANTRDKMMQDDTRGIRMEVTKMGDDDGEVGMELDDVECPGMGGEVDFSCWGNDEFDEVNVNYGGDLEGNTMMQAQGVENNN